MANEDFQQTQTNYNKCQYNVNKTDIHSNQCWHAVASEKITHRAADRSTPSSIDLGEDDRKAKRDKGREGEGGEQGKDRRGEERMEWEKGKEREG